MAAEAPTVTEPQTETQQRRLPFSFAKRNGVLVLDIEAEQPTAVCREDVRPASIAEVRRYLGRKIKWRKVAVEEFDQLLQESYESGSNSAMEMVEGLEGEDDLFRVAQELPEPSDLLESDDDAPIIRLINAVLGQAVKENASDIHIEPFENRLVVRFRVDGVLHEVLQSRRAVAPLVVSRIKVMSRLDIAEKRLPQDGRISLKVAGRAVDVRVSTIPSGHGERVVLRLLDKQAGRLNLDSLGMAPQTERVVDELIHRPHGILLVTGPTGSGKTTTLYAALARINDRSRNIMTVEDPIEYYIDGIGQTQVNTKVDMTFARGLRAILRQDPDVVMVGEIRDLETAEIAVQASLTGHLVLSTLHTNTAVGAVTRLRDMGVEPFLLSSSLLGVMAQRLVRVLCPGCKVQVTPSESERRLLNLPPEIQPEIYHARGCDDCSGTGYRGRTGIYELVVIDDDMRGMIHDGAGEQELEHHARLDQPEHPRRRRAQGAGRRHHPRGSGAGHAGSLMGAFEYTAVDKSGRQSRGVLEGDTARTVRQTLRERGLLPVAVAEVSEKTPSGRRSLSFRRGVSPMDLALVTRQLATLVRSSMPLEESLLAVSQQTEKPRLKSILLGVRSRVMEGHTLADGLGEFPQAFPELYRATVAAGEQSGFLDSILERLADYTESRQQLRQRISHAMIYPIILTVMALLIVSGLLVYVVPQVVGVFESSGQELPGLTTGLIALSDFLRANGIWVLILVVVLTSGCAAAAAATRTAAPLRPDVVASADHRPAGARHQHGPVHAHPEHPRGQRRAGARGAAHRRRGDQQHAHARGGGRYRRACARRCAHRRLAGRHPSVPADDDAPDLKRRGQRRA